MLKITPLRSREICRDKLTIRAAEIVNAVGDILADVNLAVWIRDFVDDFHGRVKSPNEK
jgi:hypothetical protein